MERILKGKPIIAGSARAEAVVSSEPISFWGGLCPRTGEIIDRRHELSGACVTGKIFVFPTGRGSSTASAILLEAIKAGVAPAAIINSEIDPILALGDIVADEMYGKCIPMVLLSAQDCATIESGDNVAIDEDGTISVCTCDD